MITRGTSILCIEKEIRIKYDWMLKHKTVSMGLLTMPKQRYRTYPLGFISV